MSNVAATIPRSPLASAGSYLRRPKPLLILILAAIAALAAAGPGFAHIAQGFAAALAAAVVVDAPFLWWKKGAPTFPDGALLTGMIVAMILSPETPPRVAAIAVAVGVLGKYVAHQRTANIFNPAALGLVVTYPFFRPAQDWWGALPEVTIYALIVLVVAGVFITDRVNKLAALLAFLGVYYLLFTVTALVGDPAPVAEVFRAPDLHAALFFGFFMVTDPPTSPARPGDQLIFGAIVAVVAYAIFEFIGAVYYLPAGLLAGNIWETLRRWRAQRAREAEPRRA